MRVIKQIKASVIQQNAATSIREIAARLHSSGARTTVLACTELPLLFPEADEEMLDATTTLAGECVRWGYGTRQ